MSDKKTPASKRFRQKIRRWSLRGRTASLPWLVDRKRIYILPTVTGVGFALIVAVIAIGGLNYANNNVLAVAFLGAGAGLHSAWRAYANLRGLQIISVNADPVYCGEYARFHINILQTEDKISQTILFEHSQNPLTEIRHNDSALAELHINTTHRGWITLEDFRLSSQYPHALFHTWTVCLLPAKCLVFPQLESPAVPIPNEAVLNHNPDLDREYAGIREYTPGDSINQIAWKSSAKTGLLHVKQWNNESHTELILHWDATYGVNYEKRISRLARWVSQAYKNNNKWALALPNKNIDLNAGKKHYRHCMEVLACMPEASKS